MINPNLNHPNFPIVHYDVCYGANLDIPVNLVMSFTKFRSEVAETKAIIERNLHSARFRGLIGEKEFSGPAVYKRKAVSWLSRIKNVYIRNDSTVVDPVRTQLIEDTMKIKDDLIRRLNDLIMASDIVQSYDANVKRIERQHSFNLARRKQTKLRAKNKAMPAKAVPLIDLSMETENTVDEIDPNLGFSLSDIQVADLEVTLDDLNIDIFDTLM